MSGMPAGIKEFCGGPWVQELRGGASHQGARASELLWDDQRTPSPLFGVANLRSFNDKVLESLLLACANLRRYTVSRFRSMPQSSRSAFWKSFCTPKCGAFKPELFYWIQIQIYCVGGQ